MELVQTLLDNQPNETLQRIAQHLSSRESIESFCASINIVTPLAWLGHLEQLQWNLNKLERRERFQEAKRVMDEYFKKVTCPRNCTLCALKHSRLCYLDWIKKVRLALGLPSIYTKNYTQVLSYVGSFMVRVTGGLRACHILVIAVRYSKLSLKL